MERFEELMAGHLEGLLTAEEREELVALVRNDPTSRHRFAALAEVDGLLWGHFVPAPARAEFVRRTMLCLPDARRQEQTVEQVMARIAAAAPAAVSAGEAPAAPPTTADERERMLRRARWLDWRLWAAVAGVALVLGAALYQVFGRGMIEQNRKDLASLAGIAKVTSVTGQVRIVTEFMDTKMAAQAGQPLAGKNGLEIEGAGRAAVKYWDGSTLELIATQGTARVWLCRTLNFPTLVKAGMLGKRVSLETGILDASVARQSANEPMILATPQAEIEVLGTKFRLTVAGDSTRLDVYEGRVQLTRRSDGKSVVVSSQEYIVAGRAGELSVRPGAAKPPEQPRDGP